jgi:MOSC domain-containing protein YiiM
MFNHRFELKDMSLRNQNLNRTGWYCRVLKEGWIEAGDEISLVERKFPRWTIAIMQNYLYKEEERGSNTGACLFARIGRGDPDDFSQSIEEEDLPR